MCVCVCVWLWVFIGSALSAGRLEGERSPLFTCGWPWPQRGPSGPRACWPPYCESQRSVHEDQAKPIKPTPNAASSAVDGRAGGGAYLHPRIPHRLKEKKPKKQDIKITGNPIQFFFFSCSVFSLHVCVSVLFFLHGAKKKKHTFLFSNPSARVCGLRPGRIKDAPRLAHTDRGRVSNKSSMILSSLRCGKTLT